ncbi:MAG TPA: hypothetical protein VNX68_12895 [Nitrosopumilaceae archaeon]|nr:hypothetical protein [Nitrosopumilaceae archaeon]
MKPETEKLIDLLIQTHFQIEIPENDAMLPKQDVTIKQENSFEGVFNTKSDSMFRQYTYLGLKKRIIESLKLNF